MHSLNWLRQGLRGFWHPSGTIAIRSLSLALQGGGSYGAFTWGVIDRFLEEERIAFDGVSGTSAGAMNAVILAAGLLRGGRDEARVGLERFWRRVSGAAPSFPFALAPANRLYRRVSPGNAIGATALDLTTRIVSPYQFNPLDLNPLRQILSEEVDFAHLRRASPFRLFVTATQVSTGRARVFRDSELTAEMVLGSACLPLLQQAVEIEGEWYWDGGYSANPSLMPLVEACGAADLVLVQLNPVTTEKLPLLSRDIVRRMNEMTFNAPLLAEIDALAALTRLCGKHLFSREPLCRRLKRLCVHRLALCEEAADLGAGHAASVDWEFLTRLRDLGRNAAQKWLEGQR